MSESLEILVQVHDGRTGRDESKVDHDGFGELLTAFVADLPLDMGDTVRLADGSTWPIIGYTELITDRGITMKVAIGDREGQWGPTVDYGDS